MSVRMLSTLLLLFSALPLPAQPPTRLPEPFPRLTELPPPQPATSPAEHPVIESKPGCPHPVVEKTIPSTQVLLVPEERAIAVPDWKLREVELGRRQGGPALDFREERRVVTEMKLQEREVEQQVTCMESRPVTVTAPCGTCRTEYHPCPVVKTVKVKVYETVPVQREVVVRIPVLKPGGEVVVKGLVLDRTTVPAIERRYQAVTTHKEIKVQIPVPTIDRPAPCVPGGCR